MVLFRLFLIVALLTIGIYTGFTVAEHGFGLIPAFFGQIAVVDWQGQFNTDFMMFLLLSGLWIAWRHKFSPLGIFLAIAGGVFGGMLFLSAYLLLESYRVKGDIHALLLGWRND